MIRVGNAPCSWGVLEFEQEGPALAYAQVLDEVHDAGYAGTELGDWGFLPTDPARLKQELEARDLALLAAFVPVDLSQPEAHAAGEAIAARTADLLAAVAGEEPLIVLADENGKHPVRTLNAGRIGPEHGMSRGQWKNFAEGANRIAAAVRRRAGLRTVFHHHCAGFVETPDEVDQLLSLTAPDLVGLCFDTGHYRFGGGEPTAGLAKHANRIWHVHFKDCQPLLAARSRAEGWDYFRSVREGVFCELGQGDVPFLEVKAALEHLGFDGWIVVEQDVLPGLGTPKESARRNRTYLQSLGL
jgi:inosose dehydratase